MTTSWELCEECGGKIWTTVDSYGISRVAGWCRCLRSDRKIDKRALEEAINKALEEIDGET